MVLLAVALVITVPTTIVIALGHSWLTFNPAEDRPATPAFLMPAVRLPGVVRADAARLREGEQVIGVHVAGHYRAYRLAALTPIYAHVVNDQIGDIPVTVSYCDRKDCARVFTAEGGQPLDVSTAGYEDGMILHIDGKFFIQETGYPVGDPGRTVEVLRTLPYTRTTWRKWRDSHPDSDIYIGALPDSAG